MTSMARIVLQAAALTPEAFAPFGDVIAFDGGSARWINAGTCQRFDDLAQIDVLAAGGRPVLSVFKALAQPLPLQVRVLERHPLSSQAFCPLDGRPFLVVVAAAVEHPGPGDIRAFLSSGSQGVNYRRNTWHHALIALHETSHFLVVDRGGPGENCEEVRIEDAVVTVTTP